MGRRGAISWADEVEREELEEKEAKIQIQENQKRNPATRPKQVIIQEREINCTNIHVESRKEKLLKENIPIPTSHTYDGKQKKPQSRTSPKQKLKNSEPTSCQYKVSQGTQTYGDEFVPPIRYPPKNLIPYLFPTIRAEPSNLRTGQFRSVSITDHGRRDDCFKGSLNQHRIILEHDVMITNKRRNTSDSEDCYYSRKRN